MEEQQLLQACQLRQQGKPLLPIIFGTAQRQPPQAGQGSYLRHLKGGEGGREQWWVSGGMQVGVAFL